MRREKKKYLLLLVLVIVLIGASVGGFVFYQKYQQYQEELRMAAELEAELEVKREIADTYLRLLYAFGGALNPEDLSESQLDRERERDGKFVPPVTGVEPNEHGIWVRPYLALRFYYHRAGVYLSYEKAVIDYFSEEFEPDGTLRLYNNGNHPEMEAFVTWMWEGRRREELLEYIETIYRSFYIPYGVEYRDQGFVDQSFFHLSPQMLDALARAEADPDYELDLTSLQEAGY